MKKGLILGLILCFVVLPAVFAAETAQVSVTVTITRSLSVSVNPGAYGFGSTSESQTLSTAVGAFSAANDGNAAQDLAITVGNSANWTAGTAAAAETYAMNYYDGASWVLIDPATGAALADDLSAGASKNFGLQLLVPTATNYGGVEQIIPVTVTASAS